MARIARIVIPDIPHHITQRGNRNQRVFFSDVDRRAYLDMARIFSNLYSVKIWAYCLMDNHVHFIVLPPSKESLIHCFQEIHRAYTRSVNFREGWRGYLWQGRFASFPMDESHLTATMRYVECNPVEAGIVTRAQDYAWSSANAHVHRSANPVLSDCYLTEQIADWASYLQKDDTASHKSIEACIRTGRPLGSEEFVQRLSKAIHRNLSKKKPGPKTPDPAPNMASASQAFLNL